MPAKREQVFVSSTYLDLVEERQGVTQVLLQANCIPAGMELFPSTNDDRWRLIQRVIDGCDYYLLIIGGRYGSVDPKSSLSYTEMEYDYAVSKNMPVMAFLHGDAGALQRDRTDLDEAKWERLEAFREKVQDTHVVQYWTSAEALQGKVAIALLDARENYPAVGWVRGDQAMTPEVQAELSELRAKVAETRGELEQAKNRSLPTIDNLAGGDDMHKIALRLSYIVSGSARERKNVTYHTNRTWNELFAIVAPSLMNEASETEVRRVLDANIFPRRGDDDLPEDFGRASESKLYNQSFENILLQFFALGLIQRGTRRRPMSDTEKYWALTDPGHDQMIRLRALRKE